MLSRRMATIKQEKAFKNLVGNRGASTFKKIMKDSGYSKAIQKNPHQVIRSKGWKELLERYHLKDRLITLIDKLAKEYESTEKIEDKRSLLGLIDYLTKIQDYYPATKIKSLEYKEEVSKVYLPEEESAPENPNPI